MESTAEEEEEGGLVFSLVMVVVLLSFLSFFFGGFERGERVYLRAFGFGVEWVGCCFCEGF